MNKSDVCNFKFATVFWGYIGVILYRILLDVNYQVVISDVFEYTGFKNDVTIDSYIFSYVVFLLSMPVVTKFYNSNRLFLSNVVVLLYLIAFIPTTSLMAFMPMPSTFFFLYVVYWGLLLYFAFFLKPFKVPVFSKKANSFLLYLLLIFFILLVLYISGKYAGFRMNFSLMNVYDLRDEERKYGLPLILEYLLPVAGNILPVLLVYFLTKSRYKLAMFIGFIVFLNFSIGGHKSVIFKLFICFLGYWFYDEKKISFYSWLLSMISFVALMEYKIVGSYMTATFLVRRVLYVPSYLNYVYYDFFSTHELDYFRQSFLRHLAIDSPYKDPIPQIIGRYYYNSDMHANNGLFSDAYYNLGSIGVLIFPFMLMVVVKLMDSFANGVNMKLLLLPVVVTVTTLNSGALMSGLLTNGLILIMLCLAILPKDKVQCINVK